MIQKIHEQLQKLGATYLRGREGTEHQEDIDYFCGKNCNIEKIHNYLTSKSFTLIKNTQEKKTYFKIEKEANLIIDIDLSFDYIFKYIPTTCFQEKFLKNYLKNPVKSKYNFNFMRYILMNRNKDKYIEYIIKNSNNITLEQAPLSKLVFAKKYTISNIISSIKAKKHISLHKYLSLRYKFLFYISYLGIALKHFNTGKSIAFCGADGIGKTTLLINISQVNNFRYIYMGNNNFIFQNLYDNLSKKKFFPFKILKFFLVYIENIIRLIKITIHKILGRTVLLDRYPSLKFFGTCSKHKILNYIAYKVFYKNPDKIIILYLEPEKIIKRKSELTEEEITSIYHDLKEKTKGNSSCYWIKNIDLNNTATEVFKLLL